MFRYARPPLTEESADRKGRQEKRSTLSQQPPRATQMWLAQGTVEAGAPLASLVPEGPSPRLAPPRLPQGSPWHLPCLCHHTFEGVLTESKREGQTGKRWQKKEDKNLDSFFLFARMFLF